MTRSATMATMSAAIIDPKLSKSLTLPTRGRGRGVRDLETSKCFQPQPLEATFIYPLNGRAMSAPRLPQQSTMAEDMREKYWGTFYDHNLE